MLPFESTVFTLKHCCSLKGYVNCNYNLMMMMMMVVVDVAVEAWPVSRGLRQHGGCRSRTRAGCCALSDRQSVPSEPLPPLLRQTSSDSSPSPESRRKKAIVRDVRSLCLSCNVCMFLLAKISMLQIIALKHTTVSCNYTLHHTTSIQLPVPVFSKTEYQT